MKKIETLDDAFIRIAELERENEALREELAYYKNRKMSGRRKHNAKWQAIYKDFVEGYEDGMAMVDIAKRNHVSSQFLIPQDARAALCDWLEEKLQQQTDKQE